jgi:hypothetical protein
LGRAPLLPAIDTSEYDCYLSSGFLSFFISHRRIKRFQYRLVAQVSRRGLIEAPHKGTGLDCTRAVAPFSLSASLEKLHWWGASAASANGQPCVPFSKRASRNFASAADELFHDLVRPSVDARHTRVGQRARNRILKHVPDAQSRASIYSSFIHSFIHSLYSFIHLKQETS